MGEAARIEHARFWARRRKALRRVGQKGYCRLALFIDEHGPHAQHELKPRREIPGPLVCVVCSCGDSWVGEPKEEGEVIGLVR